MASLNTIIDKAIRFFAASLLDAIPRRPKLGFLFDLKEVPVYDASQQAMAPVVFSMDSLDADDQGS